MFCFILQQADVTEDGHTFEAVEQRLIDLHEEAAREVKEEDTQDLEEEERGGKGGYGRGYGGYGRGYGCGGYSDDVDEEEEEERGKGGKGGYGRGCGRK